MQECEEGKELVDYYNNYVCAIHLRRKDPVLWMR